MSKNLVIVESPAKGKTIEKFLGPDYKVLASFGHVRALPSKQGSVDIEKGFEPKYHVLPESKKHLDAIKAALKGADRLLLATDPDREGEAISWHLLAALGLDKKAPGIKIQRVEFHEITKDAILHAVKNPRDIALDLVNAQQARSILDYLVGFNLSPFLWKKIRYGLSAGRVQSVALRLVCEREKEILAFNEQEYWTIAARLGVAAGQEFKAGLVDVGGKKLGKFDIPGEAVASALKAALQSGSYQVAKVTKTEKKRNPSPPFTTSTLQQEASRKLGFSAKKTMSTAQRLYEGIDIGAEGTVGLITYMRTDSVNLSTLALKDAHDVIAAAYGKEYALAKPRIFKTKSKNAQEAHEAVRPTYIAKTPAELKKYLTPDLHKLYELIWKRTVACQMAEALLDQTSVDITADLATAPAKGPFAGAKRCGLRAAGTVIRFPGFMKLYIEGLDDQDEEKEGLLPAMSEGAALKLHEILPEQHFTQPPPRYTEATLVKTLEEYGIGRPSTFASIMNTLVERKYARLDKKRFFPAGRCRHGGQRPADGPFPEVRRLQLYRRAGRGTGPGLPRRKRVEAALEGVLGAVYCASETEGGRSQQGRPDDRGHRRDLPGMRQAAGRETRQARQIHRLFRLPGRVQIHPQRRPGRGRGRRTGDLGRKVRKVRPADADQGRPLRQVPGLFRLPGLQEYPAADQAEEHRRGLPRVQGG